MTLVVEGQSLSGGVMEGRLENNIWTKMGGTPGRKESMGKGCRHDTWHENKGRGTDKHRYNEL